MRFDHKLFTHEQAVANTRTLFDAARKAGVRRIVHVSITNPDLHSDLPYFKDKAELEQSLVASDLSYCILRPTVLFGKEDVLINNIAWALRFLPVYGVYGKGDYRLQPIYVDAIGPETFTYRWLVQMIAEKLGVRRAIIGVPPSVGYWSCWLTDLLVRDVVATREEIRGLMEDRLFVKSPPLGCAKLSEWVVKHKDTLGRHYTSEMRRRFDRTSSYKSN